MAGRSESVEQKGQRLYRQGGVVEEYRDQDMVSYSIQSGENEYEVTFDRWENRYECDCPARRRDCSHVHAVKFYRRAL